MPSSSASSADLEELVAFCRAHPAPDSDPERFLRRLASGPAAMVDMRSEGLVAVIIDLVRSATGCPPLELVGLRGETIAPAAARRLVAESLGRARALGLPGIEFLVRPLWAPHRDMLEELGFVFAYGDLDMECVASEAWGPDAAIPEGWQWSDVGERWVSEYFRVQNDAFVGIPGFFMPSEAEMRRALAKAGMSGRILNDGRRGSAILRLNLDEGIIHAVARDPAFEGRGLGRLALDEARRRMPGRPLYLNVVDSNRKARALYERHGFRTTIDLPALIHRFG